MENPYLKAYYDMIESCISDLGLDAVGCRQHAGRWALAKGVSTVWIDVWHSEVEGRGYYKVQALVMPVPEGDRETLYSELLELNSTLYGAAFIKANGYIYVSMVRELDAMEQIEAAAVLIRVGTYADEHEHRLKVKYHIEADGKAG